MFINNRKVKIPNNSLIINQTPSPIQTAESQNSSKMVSTILLSVSVLALSICCIFLSKSLRLHQRQITTLTSQFFSLRKQVSEHDGELSALTKSNFDDFSRLVKLELELKHHTFLHHSNFYKTQE